MYLSNSSFLDIERSLGLLSLLVAKIPVLLWSLVKPLIGYMLERIAVLWAYYACDVSKMSGDKISLQNR